MNVSVPTKSSVSVPVLSLHNELTVSEGVLTLPENKLALTVSYSGQKPLDCITVIFPSEPKTVFIRDVTSPSLGEIVTFRRPAPRVAEIALQTARAGAKRPFQIVLRVSSPTLQLPVPDGADAADRYKAFVGNGPWPPDYKKARRMARPNDGGDGEDVDTLLSTLASAFADNSDRFRAKKFFLEYDYATHPLLLGSNPILQDPEKAIRASLVQKFLPILQQRVRMRGYCTMISQGQKSPTKADLRKVRLTSDEGGIDAPLEKAEVKYLSALQRDIIEHHYSVSKKDQLAKLRRAFEDFADGRLREESQKEGKTRAGEPSSASNGEPDSAHLFFFAEFACTAIEYGVDTAFWRKLLPILSDIQPIYVNRYGSEPLSARPSARPFESFDEAKWGKYGGKTFDGQRPRFGLRVPRRERAQEQISLEIGKHVSDAFGADHIPAPVKPSPGKKY